MRADVLALPLITGRLNPKRIACAWSGKCIETGMLDPVAGNLERYMDLLSARQRLVASNIANIDTPGYRSKDIDFQFEFMSQLPGAAPRVVETPGLQVNNDGNNVSLDRESRLLSENALRFSVAENLLKSQLHMTRLAIEEGKSA